ncbi:hypothetical protein Tco_0824588 [Tanacetum coccineum]|uniref:Uncharacterized protein n=1 Tax=Tanacetum coccineum TaxID=301880 RepID=A0ABQ5AQU6_9ASTR
MKGKSMADCSESVSKSKVIARVVHKLDLEPLSSKLKNKREAHVDYIRITKENADTLCDIVEQARILNPLDNALAYALPPRKPVKSTVMKNIKPSNASQWRPSETKHVCLSSEPRIVEAKTTNHLEPNKNKGSNDSISPCSSSVQCSSYKSYLVNSRQTTMIQDCTFYPSSEETTLQGVVPSNLHHLNQSFDTLTKLKKNHPLENVIGNPSRPVLTRSQLQEQAIWCLH